MLPRGDYNLYLYFRVVFICIYGDFITGFLENHLTVIYFKKHLPYCFQLLFRMYFAESARKERQKDISAVQPLHFLS